MTARPRELNTLRLPTTTALAALSLGMTPSVHLQEDQDTLETEWTCSKCGSTGVFRCERWRMRPALLGAPLQCNTCLARDTIQLKVRAA